MPKYNNEYYIELSRKLFNEDKFKKLPYQSRWIYTVLVENQHRFENGKNDDSFFFRSDKDLAKDCGMPIRTMQKYKAALIKSNTVEFFYTHFKDTETSKISSKKISAYRILK